MRLTLADLEEFCNDGEEESPRIEFKSCSELRPTGGRARDDVVLELSKDVSAFLNSAGGTIVYGIREHNSRAQALDASSAFTSSGDPRPEKVLQWVRAHVAPAPTVDVYSVPLQPADRNSSWFLVVEIPQGQQAYMAKDRRFYKRVGNIVQPMEQYEVVDAMMRTRGPFLDLRLGPIRPVSRGIYATERREKATISMPLAVTTTNFVAAEYGAIKLFAVAPLLVDRLILSGSFSGSQLRSPDELVVGQSPLPGESLTIRLGGSSSSVIYPGDWYDFYGNPFSFEIPVAMLSGTAAQYAFVADLFSDAPARRHCYILRVSGDDTVALEEVGEIEFEQRI
jgi:hypothetical protein